MKESMVYPGEYIMLPDVEELLHDITTVVAYHGRKTRMNMTEKKDCFEIDISLKGIQRQDLFLYAHGNILSLAILSENSVTDKHKKLRIHKPGKVCMQRHIPLPGNADMEFMSAEYRRDILHICIPKTAGKPAVIDRQIIVY